MSGQVLQILLFLPFLLLVWFLWKLLRPRNQHSLRSVAILVLGDIGRSPRMMYHAQSFAENGFVTDLIGYGGSKPIPSLERLPRVRMRHLPELPRIFHSLPFLLTAPIKVLYQIISILLCLLVWIDIPPEFILVQNPPSIPTLALVQLVGRIHGSKVIIDWHNLGYSILALKLGKAHPLVRIAAWLEATFGRFAYAHLFVTRAMRDFLVKKWDIQGHKVVLYDRPPHHFHRSSAQETHELFCKLQQKLILETKIRDFLPTASIPFSTVMTQISERDSPDTGSPSLSTYSEVLMPTSRSDRPALIVSSTSWTPDEDFSILLDALQIYDTQAQDLANKRQSKERLPKLLLHETWKWVRCVSLWLEAEDYPTLLGSADLGVCLHDSSSALDLPMKVVDMFGCGLPVCALAFECLDELVKNGENGLIFQSASELASQLEQLLLSFPNAPALRTLRASLDSMSRPSRQNEIWTWGTWEENWDRVIKPLILSDVHS
ncbi:beta-1,4-mannosyltransferase [Gymnopilus junonius]|uniref:Chitobiosyldiphosphodolichol beta-mannosyltransferase n=1 Tax=Gymnopilus junonius TaxID=109634 RepID=A0A9P5P240_GYMJU|nr:beta-1,4-mannosyltransferase [Gymnopilus junonius]